MQLVFDGPTDGHSDTPPSRDANKHAKCFCQLLIQIVRHQNLFSGVGALFFVETIAGDGGQMWFQWVVFQVQPTKVFELAERQRQ